MYWFTSDTHFGHKNIVKLMNRQVETVEEMDELMITRWNNKVRPNDIVYHIGDFAFGNRTQIQEILQRLNGRIHIILGNHDSRIKDTPSIQKRFESITLFKTIRLDDCQISMFHAPILEWPNMELGTIHLHGHTHGGIVTTDCRRIDVGVDTTEDLAPISWELIKKRALALPIRGRFSKDNRAM